MPIPPKRTRRSPEQEIVDLEARIAVIRARSERRKVKKDPTLRHIAAALRSVDKALGMSRDHATRQVLDEVRATLGAALSLNGAAFPARRGVKLGPPRGGLLQIEEVLSYIASHPGSRCQEIAAATGVDTRAVSPLLKSLKTEGKVRSEGQARGTRYFVTAAR